MDPSLVDEKVMVVDFGATGGFCYIDEGHIKLVDMPQSPPAINRLLARVRPKKLVGEEVHGMPDMNVVAVSTFMRGVGRIEGQCDAWQIDLEYISPAQWTRWYGIGKRKHFKTKHEWKKHLKAHAEKLFPDLNITMGTADAVLIWNFYFNPQRVVKLSKPTFV